MVKLTARRMKQKAFDFVIDSGTPDGAEAEEVVVAEEAEEYEEIDLVDKFNFYDCDLDKKAFASEIKNIMKLLLPLVKQQRPDDEADFKLNMKNMVNEIVSNFAQYRF